MKLVLGALNDELLVNLVLRAVPYCNHVDAAVAYADGRDHVLVKACKEHEMFLRFFGLLDEGGAVSPGLLRELLSWGQPRAEARLVKKNFHAKVIWWRGYGAYVGSANLTHKAWFHNVEAGVFVDEAELLASGMGAELDELFAHLEGVSIAVTRETVDKLEELERARAAESRASKLSATFDRFFGHLPDNPALTVKAPKPKRETLALQRFATEWMSTLQTMRDVAREFASLGLRPRWVDADAHPAVHFDQFLHAFYYDRVRGAHEDDDERSTLDKIEERYRLASKDRAGALREAARWWSSLPDDLHGEERYIRETAPAMRSMLSRESLAKMTMSAELAAALRGVNAFRTHARQMKKSELDVADDVALDVDSRVERLCAWLWPKRSPKGKSVLDALQFVLWGSDPPDMERRLFHGVWSDEYRLPHLGQSTLGEAVGWARPDEYPPRNDRTNKALRALGYDVKLFSK